MKERKDAEEVIETTATTANQNNLVCTVAFGCLQCDFGIGVILRLVEALDLGGRILREQCLVLETVKVADDRVGPYLKASGQFEA